MKHLSWQILQPYRPALSRTPTSQTFTEVISNYLREYLHHNWLVTITRWSKLLGGCQMEQPESAFCHLPNWNLEIAQTEGLVVMSSPTDGLVLLRAKQHRQTHSLPFLQNMRFTKTWRAIAVNYYLHLFFIKNYDIMCKRPLWKDRWMWIVFENQSPIIITCFCCFSRSMCLDRHLSWCSLRRCKRARSLVNRSLCLQEVKHNSY